MDDVLKAAIHAIPEFLGLPKMGRFQMSDFITLFYRRSRGYLIMMHEIFRSDFEPDIFFAFVSIRSLKLSEYKRVKKPRVNKLPWNTCLLHRVINSWNILPKVVFEPSGYPFRRRMDT